MKLRTLLAVILILAGWAVPSQAQDSEPGVQNLVSFNPFLAAFGWYSGEYERVINDQFTFGIGGSYVQLDEDDDDKTTYGGGDVFIRLFPQLGAPSGLFFAGQLGFRNITDTYTVGFFGPSETIEESYTWMAAGFSIGFTYLFGANENYVVSVGAGVTKLLGDPDEASDLSTTLPTIRLVNLGFGF